MHARDGLAARLHGAVPEAKSSAGDCASAKTARTTRSPQLAARRRLRRSARPTPALFPTQAIRLERSEEHAHSLHSLPSIESGGCCRARCTRCATLGVPLGPLKGTLALLYSGSASRDRQPLQRFAVRFGSMTRREHRAAVGPPRIRGCRGSWQRSAKRSPRPPLCEGPGFVAPTLHGGHAE